MCRLRLVCVILMLLAPMRAHASPFGFSINVNFATENPIQGPTGLFGDTVWNQLTDNQGNLPLYGDFNNELIQTEAQVSWSSRTLERAKGVVGGNPGDQAMMGTYLGPSEIRLVGLDQMVPMKERFNYHLVLYTYGGLAGEEGTYRINGRDHLAVDTGRFKGDFIEGPLGNMLIIKDLIHPDLFIKTAGHAPINAMSLVYCLNGDFDGDGFVDVSDLESLSEAVKSGDDDLAFDVNLDLTLNHDDVMSWIKCSKGTCVGDVNLDGVFNSDDLVELFTEGLYNTDNDATWTSGDWNGDCRFDSDDLVLAFIEGCYDTETILARSHASLMQANDSLSGGSGAVASQVPEPNTLSLFVIASIWMGMRRRPH